MTVRERAETLYAELQDDLVRKAFEDVVSEAYIDAKLAEVREYDGDPSYWHTWEETMEWIDKCCAK